MTRDYPTKDPSTQRPLIAMLGDQLSDFQMPIVDCLNRHLTRAGFGLVYVCGGALKPTAHWREEKTITRNAIYSLAQEYPVAGFVILTASIGQHANTRQLTQFARQFTHRPVVCYGSSIPGLASVQIDYYTMMSRLMEHMMADSRRKRFVFLRGAPENPRSLTLERAFRDALTHRQIPIDESLFLDGNYHANDAYEAMDGLLAQCSDIDAVVAANDEMAQTAIHALAGHGLHVPEDVIVSGFHNSLTASTSLPPITTVHCTVDSLAALATASLQSQMLSGEFVNSNSKVLHPPARLIIRASSEAPLSSEQPALSLSQAFDAVQFRTALLHGMSSLSPPAGLIMEAVIDDVVSMLVNGSPFKDSRLEAALKNLQSRSVELFWWRHLHRQITANLEMQGCEGQSSDALSRAAMILGKIHETLWDVERSTTLKQECLNDIEERFHASLMQVSCTEDLIEALDEISEHCGAKSGFLCIYERPGERPDEFARVLYQRPTGILNQAAASRFPAADILPGEFPGKHFPGPLILEPLCIGTTHLGYLVLDGSGEAFHHPIQITRLSDYISTALWRLQSETRAEPYDNTSRTAD